jgi:hypothetical protein
MKRQKFILLMLGVVLAACSPRVDDIFDDTAVVRLEQRREALMKQFIEAPDGWVMQYFARIDPTTSDTLQHRGYTFLMQFREDGTVTIGARVDGLYKTETSMWDIINDNSSVLTFNTFNSIFHYYSNPDPDLGLWGADGEGIGGDYEFMVLEYNDKQNYQLLKGKKNGCYIRMYPLQAGQDWEDYLAQIDAMNNFLLAENVEWDLYQDDLHWTLYNVRSHEFRVFTYGEDTLGGGSYYGYITTPAGIYMNGGVFDLVVQEYEYDEYGNKTGEKVRDTVINMPRDAFVLNAERTRLVAVDLSDTYITIDALNLFASAATVWRFDKGLNEEFTQLETTVSDNMSAKVPNSSVASYGWKKGADGRYELYVYYSMRGQAASNYDIYYFNAKEAGRHSIELTYDAPHPTRSNLKNFGILDLVPLFNGVYDLELTQAFAPSKGITATRRENTIVLKMAH